jgi:hypothetical protein
MDIEKNRKMTFIRIVTDEHLCIPPEAEEEIKNKRYRAGTVYECDICHSQWELNFVLQKFFWRLINPGDQAHMDTTLTD